MKHPIITSLLLFISISCFAQTHYPSMLWLSRVEASTVNPDGSGIEVFDVAVEPVSGAAYVAVRCAAPCTFAPGITLEPGIEGEFLALAKYDTEGVLEWVKSLGYVGDLYKGAHLCSANLDGVYIAAPFGVQQLDFGNNLQVLRKCPNLCDEMFIAKYNPEGEAQWATAISGSDGAFLSVAGVEVNSAGTLFMAGNYEGSNLDFGESFTYNNLASHSFFLASYNASNGDLQAVHFVAPESGASFLQQLAVNNNGQVILVGGYINTLKFANGLSLAAPTGTIGSFVAGLSTNGNANWVRSVNSSNYFNILGIDMDEAGYAYLAMDAAVDLRVDGNPIMTINNKYAGIVLKLDQTSHSVPVFIEYDTDDFAVMDVELDPFGNIYTAGYISKSIEIGSSEVTVDGCLDALITATSNDGMHQWARSLGGMGCEGLPNLYYGSSIAFDNAGFMHGAGLFFTGFNEEGYMAPGTGAFVTKFANGMVGTEEVPLIGDLKISPNPSPGHFSVSLDETPSIKTRLTVTDLDGREVHHQAITELQTLVNTSLPAGAYLVTVQNGLHLERQKLIVQH